MLLVHVEDFITFSRKHEKITSKFGLQIYIF